MTDQSPALLLASNLSGMTTAQSAIAAELAAYEEAMWFTSAFLIAMSSMSPLVGRLASVISSGTLILATSAVFAVGGVIASQAASFGAFMVGRVICGVGASGVMTLPVILVLQLVPRKHRGLFVALINCCFTVGLSTGAVVAGALIGPLGWVGTLPVACQTPVGPAWRLTTKLDSGSFSCHKPP
jgi:MFS family permease